MFQKIPMCVFISFFKSGVFWVLLWADFHSKRWWIVWSDIVVHWFLNSSLHLLESYPWLLEQKASANGLLNIPWTHLQSQEDQAACRWSWTFTFDMLVYNHLSDILKTLFFAFSGLKCGAHGWYHTAECTLFFGIDTRMKLCIIILQKMVIKYLDRLVIFQLLLRVPKYLYRSLKNIFVE